MSPEQAASAISVELEQVRAHVSRVEAELSPVHRDEYADARLFRADALLEELKHRVEAARRTAVAAAREEAARALADEEGRAA